MKATLNGFNQPLPWEQVCPCGGKLNKQEVCTECGKCLYKSDGKLDIKDIQTKLKQMGKEASREWAEVKRVKEYLF